jgi:competence protein ComEC
MAHRRLQRPSRCPRVATRCAGLGWAVLCLPWTTAPAGLELHALDVGHGSALVLRAPGEGCWIFDAGSRDRLGVAGRALAPLLRAWDVSRVNVVLSHDDRDHWSALGWVVERYPIGLWSGALPPRLEARLSPSTVHLDLRSGRLALASGRGLTLELLRGRDAPGNEGSRSLLVTCGTEQLLLCGDAEAEGLGDLLGLFERSSAYSSELRLLLFPHHGSQTSLMGPLLASTRPQEIWISAAGDNLQRPGVAAELDRRGLTWRWTTRDGPLNLLLTPDLPGP